MSDKNPLPALVFCALLPFVTSAYAQIDYEAGDEFTDNLRSGGSGPTMVVIPAGSLSLGAVQGGPQGVGRVTFSRDFAVSATEISAGQYRQFLTATQSAQLRKFSIDDDSLPVYGVSWDEAEAYVTWLSRETGHYYRLPSATEWEYTARAGTSTTYSWGNDLGNNRANCLDCGSKFTGRFSPVGSFEPNSWKVYDMHGNVWEWTKDCVDSNSAPPPNGLPQLFGNCDSRELRGGSAESDGWSIRSGSRAFGTRKRRADDVGFRVVMDIPE
jgi:formylglycine-generating enzyme required for sulfatase activity